MKVYYKVLILEHFERKKIDRNKQFDSIAQAYSYCVSCGIKRFKIIKVTEEIIDLE